MTTAEHVAGQLDLDGTPVPPAAVAAPNPTTVVVSIEIEVDLAAEECWPDGEPEHWTVEDLAADIKRQSPSLGGFLSDWDLLDLGGTVQLHDGRGNWTTVQLR